MTRHTHLAATIAAVLATTCSILAAPPSFTGLGSLDPSTGIVAYALSADGTTVACTAGREACLWTASTGIVGLGDQLPPDALSSRATGVSADGATLVGMFFTDSNGSAFRLSQTTDVIEPAGLPKSYGVNGVTGVSGDGRKVVGNAVRPGEWCEFCFYECVRSRSSESAGFTQDEPGAALQRLRPLKGSDESTVAGVSLDGTTIVGYSWEGRCQWYPRQACFWVGSVPVALGFLPGGYDSQALAVSGDGSVIVGWSSSWSSGTSSPQHAFRWTAATGMIDLGDLVNGAGYSLARAVSADGEIVLGETYNDDGSGVWRLFIWDQTNGMRDLREVLVDLGLDLTGWTLREAVGISADGLTLVGNGINPDGQYAAWIAHLGDQ